MKKLTFPHIGTSAVSCDPISMAKMRADTFNQSAGSLTGYDCVKCKNRGGFLVPQENSSVRYQECGCMIIRSCLSRMEASGLRNIIKEKTFDVFEANEAWQQTIKAAAQKYSHDMEGWFLICGQSGCGKTHLCTAICRERLLLGDEVRYMPWRDEIAFLKTACDIEAREKKIHLWKTAQILYVDDLFKIGAGSDHLARPTSADINVAFEILNYRYCNHLSTILSSELTVEELLSLDEALAGRVLEMSANQTFVIQKDPHKNYRLKGISEIA